MLPMAEVEDDITRRIRISSRMAIAALVLAVLALTRLAGAYLLLTGGLYFLDIAISNRGGLFDTVITLATWPLESVGGAALISIVFGVSAIVIGNRSLRASRGIQPRPARIIILARAAIVLGLLDMCALLIAVVFVIIMLSSMRGL